jgi:hypothetical protein
MAIAVVAMAMNTFAMHVGLMQASLSFQFYSFMLSVRAIG